MNGFYVTDIQAAKLAGMRLKLGETRAYPKNAGLTVEYQLMADPGACLSLLSVAVVAAFAAFGVRFVQTDVCICVCSETRRCWLETHVYVCGGRRGLFSLCSA